jgi:2-polyprenyl-3-methyl-5-hydroxy-6-metoxy-1,4-benzoquinol methylase
MTCRNCNSKEVENFYNKVWSVDNGSVYKCAKCELIFIDPIMSEDEEQEFYKNYNEHVKKRGVIVENSVEEFHEKSKIIANERLSVVKQFFQNKKVLEVGSSTGAFLTLLDGCDTNACELATDNLNYSKQFINGKAYSSIDEVKENDFDVICMYHVFEHIRNPIEFLNTCKPLLNGGVHCD